MAFICIPTGPGLTRGGRLRGRRVGQVAADVADVQAARDVARTVRHVQVDTRDEAGARARAERHMRPEVEAVSVVGDRVGVGVAAARELGDALAPCQAELFGRLSERAPEAVGVGVQARELVELARASSSTSAGRRYGLARADRGRRR